jgi:uncharacterized protein
LSESIPSIFRSVNQRDSEGNTPLIRDCKEGNIINAKLLIQNGADVNLGNEWGSKPLMYACSKGNLELVKLLLEKKVRVRSITSQ